MKNELINLIDFEKVNTLLEGFNKTTGFVTAILDLEGNVLSKSGWRQICTEFHRVNSETSKKCTISDTVLAGKLAEGEKYHFYKCLNGLVDVAVPIIINNEHIANLFSGQFFFDEPDKDFFRKQAEKYGFENGTYFKALENVPVVSQEKVQTAMDFLLNMTQLISETTFQKIEQIELNNIIRESEEKYRMLYETAGVGIGYYTPEGIIISYNSIAAQNMNGKPEDFAGKSVFELFPKPEAEFYLERVKKAAISETPQVYEDKVDLSGGTQWFNSVFTRIVDSNNKIAGIQIISTDISDQKLAEEEKQNLLDRFNRIVSNVPGAIFEFCLNPDGTSYIPYISEGFTTIFEITPDVVKTDSTPLFQLVHPVDQENFYKSITESAKKLTPWQNENRFILPSGEIIWVEGKSTPQKLEDGSIIWQGYLNNVTERKNAEKMLYESEEKYRQLYESNQMPISIFDTETLKFLSVNNAFVEKYGYSKDEFLKMTVLDIRPESEIEKLKTSVKTTDNRLVNAGVYLHKKKNGQIIHVEILRYDLVFEGKNAKLVFANDITERIKAEEELKLAEERFEKSFRLSPYLVSITAMDGQVLEVNDMIFETFGYTREEFLGNNTTVLPIWVHPEERAASIKQLKQDGFLREMEVKYRKKSGEIGDFLLSAVIVELNKGKVLLSIINNVTERKQKEKALLESEAKFRATAEFSPLAIYASSGPDQKGEYVNPAFSEIFGFTLEDVPTVGEWWIKAFPDEKYRQWVIETWQKNIEDAEKNKTTVAALECVCNCKDGSQKIISWEGSNIGDSFWAFGLDLTERVEAEKALKESEERLRLSTELGNVAVWEFDFRTNNMTRSKNHDQLYGLEVQEKWEFETFLIATHPDDREFSNEIIQKSAAPSGPDNYKFDFRVVYPDKSIHWLMVTGQVIERNEKGEGIIVRGTLIDITDRKLAEMEIKKLNEELEIRVEARTNELSNSQAALMNLVEDLNEKSIQLEKSTTMLETKNKELETFTYSVSHDLKAPLRGIDGYSRLLEDEYYDILTGDGQKFVKTIREGTKQMNQLIEDLLAYSRLERSTLRPSSINSKQFIDGILAFFKDDILKNNVVIKKEITECQIITDSDGLTIALRNILENAIKFSSKVSAPEIKISLKENVHSWLLSVEDNGIGFDMKYQKRIFEIFQRLNLPEQFAGTGIGLAMVNKSIERMGGKIWADSEIGKGAKFYIEISK